MSKESYIRGFCKAAAAAGVDPIALAKYAYNLDDVKAYKKSLTDAGMDATKYLTEQEKTQPLPSGEDIKDAFRHAKTEEQTGRASSVLDRIGGGNPTWWERFKSSIGQESIMPKEKMRNTTLTALRGLANIVRGKAVDTLRDHGGYWNHREIPEDVFRGAWPAFTNAVGYGSAPVRPIAQRIVVGK